VQSHPMSAGSTITSTTLPQSVVTQGVQFLDPGQYGAGPSVFFGQAQLSTIYGTHDAGRNCTECRSKIMTKSDFRALFIRALDIAAENAKLKLPKPIPRSFVVELHAPGYSGRTVSVDEALDQIYLGSDSFYRIIDVAIKRLLPGGSVAFVRVSGPPPAEFGRTWDPTHLGPFKQILAEEIEDRATA
jgi:hypothetical protein